MEPYQRLEVAWAEFNGLDPEGMVACSSGTAALHLALEAFRLQAGSEVIMPDFSMIACPRAVVLAGLTPVLVDCGEDLNLDPSLLQDVTNRYSAILSVHTYGRRCEMERIITSNGGLGWNCFIEDLAEAHGIRPHPQTDAACWSFYRNKVVAGEEGGAVWFKDKEHARLARSLRCLGFTEEHDFRHIPRGHNYRLSNLHAEAILHGRNGLDHYAMNLKERRDIEAWYEEECPAEWRMPAREVPWVYDLRIPGLGEELQDIVVEELRKAGIAARHGFKPVGSQAEFQRCRMVTNGQRDCYESNARVASREVLYLPLSPGQVRREDCRRAFALLCQLIQTT